MNFYRFSISWSRIMSRGDRATINEAGLQYYDNLINELIANDIQPMITMYHFDLPQALQEIGGMTNPLIVKYFEDYADILFARYSDRVKTWITFNEPINICENGYANGDIAPVVFAPGVGGYLCAHNLLIAHAKMYDLFHGKHHKDGNKLGLVLNCGFRFPLDPNSLADIEASDRAMQFFVCIFWCNLSCGGHSNLALFYYVLQCGWFANPIFSKVGGYPPIMVEAIAARSNAEGRAGSRLPYMSAEIRDLIRGEQNQNSPNKMQHYSD